MNNIQRIYQKLKYRGKDVCCPICQSTFSEFLPFGIIPRSQALCPGCDSLERHRLIWFYMNEHTLLFSKWHYKGKKIDVLHFAPEDCLYKRLSRISYINYVPCDLNPIDYKFKVRKEDLTKTSFPNNSFDVILCNHVLEHIPDDKKAMEELYRIMKPGGWGIFQVPIDYKATTYENPFITDPQEREKHFGQWDHVRMYGKDYPQRLRNAGFKVEENKFIETFSDQERSYYGFMPGEIIYQCFKR